jgi:probable HAF family extracellular repeat protein
MQPAMFRGLGQAPDGTASVALAVSADGTVVAGYSGAPGAARAVRWLDGRMTVLDSQAPGLFAVVSGLSADGSVAAGSIQGPGDMEGAYWLQGQERRLSAAGGQPGAGEALGVSADGHVIVGRVGRGSKAQAALWHDGVMQLLPAGSAAGAAFATSADGSVIAGSLEVGSETRAVLWTGGQLTKLDTLPGGGRYSVAYAVSAVGAVAAGQCDSMFGLEACVWVDGRVVGLGGLTDHHEFLSSARGVSADGQVVVGSALGRDDASRAFLWTAADGMQALQEVLARELSADLRGWVLTDALAVSADGRTVVGAGRNPRGETEAWMARRPAGAPPAAAAVEPVSETPQAIPRWHIRYVRTVEVLHPAGVAFDLRGGLHVCEPWNDAIRVFASRADPVSMVVQPPSAWRLPHDVAFDAGGFTYVADSANHRVSVLDATGAAVLQWGQRGAGAGEFNRPQGIAVGGGRVFVADTGNDRIQVFDRHGRHLAGWGSFGHDAGQLNQPVDLAVTAAGHVFVADTENHRVAVYDERGTWLRTWGQRGTAPGLFNQPTGVDCQGGAVYVADRGNRRVQVFSEAGELLACWPRASIRPHEGEGRLSAPQRLGIAPSGGEIAICEEQEDRCQVFELVAGDNAGRLAAAPDAPTASPTFDGQLDVHGALLAIPDAHSGAVVLYRQGDLQPQPITRIGGFGRQPGRCGRPAGVALDVPRARALVSDAGNCALLVFDLGAAAADVSAYTPNLCRFIRSLDGRGLSAGAAAEVGATQTRPGALSCALSGETYVIDQTRAAVIVLDPDLKPRRVLGCDEPQSGALRWPTAVSVARDENRIYVTDLARRAVVVLDPAGQPPAVWGGPGSGPAEFMAPYGIASGHDGFVYVTDTGTHDVKKFTESGEWVSAWGGRGITAGRFFKPMGIAQDGAGRLYVLDQGNRRCQVFSAEGEFVAVFGEPLYCRPAQAR